MRILQGGNIIRAIDGVRSMARIVCLDGGEFRIVEFGLWLGLDYDSFDFFVVGVEIYDYFIALGGFAGE